MTWLIIGLGFIWGLCLRRVKHSERGYPPLTSFSCEEIEEMDREMEM